MKESGKQLPNIPNTPDAPGLTMSDFSNMQKVHDALLFKTPYEATTIDNKAREEYNQLIKNINIEITAILGNNEEIVPGTLPSHTNTVLMHCINKNLKEAKGALGDLALNFATDEGGVKAYNLLSPLVGALSVIDRIK